MSQLILYPESFEKELIVFRSEGTGVKGSETNNKTSSAYNISLWTEPLYATPGKLLSRLIAAARGSIARQNNKGLSSDP